jgi:hypothetical protein
MLLALMVYFVLGLWVMSQARLEMMRARWLADGVEADANIVRNWRRGSLVLLLAFAVVAAFLPIGSTFAAASLLEALFAVALVISQLAFLLLTTLLVGLVGLLGIGASPEEGQELLRGPTPTPQPSPSGAAFNQTTALLAGGVFWLLVACVALIALVFFLRDRGVTLRYEPLARLWRALRRWLAHIGSRARQRAAGVQRALGRRLQEMRPGAGPASTRWRFLRVNALPPREQIRFFYLSTLRRASEEGLPREKNETPMEYAQELRSKWPEAGEEIELLTGAFLEARYSQRDFDRQDVSPLKQVWKRVRRTIRRRLSP